MSYKIYSSILTIIVIVGCCFGGNAQMQQSVNVCGQFFEGGTKQISFNIGEPVIKTVHGADIMLTQGFFQPRLWVTAIDDMKGISYHIEAYPNPATDHIYLSTDKELPKGSTYQVFDMHGGLIARGDINNGLTTKISLEKLVPASYFLKVTRDKQALRIVKIIKK